MEKCETTTDKREDPKMTYRRACMAFGNGDIGRGKENIFRLAKRLEEARQKHPLFARDMFDAWHIIGEEFHELENALGSECSCRQIDEALDVACTVMRFVNGEHKA